jgi:hypothetical protein
MEVFQLGLMLLPVGFVWSQGSCEAGQEPGGGGGNPGVMPPRLGACCWAWHHAMAGPRSALPACRVVPVLSCVQAMLLEVRAVSSVVRSVASRLKVGLKSPPLGGPVPGAGCRPNDPAYLAVALPLTLDPFSA